MNKGKVAEKLNDFFGDKTVRVFMPKQFLSNLSDLLVKQNKVLIEQVKENNISPELVTEHKKTQQLLIELTKAIKEKKIEKVEVTNLKEYPKFPDIKIPEQKEIKIPEYPTKINLIEPSWYGKMQNKLINFLIEGIQSIKKSFSSDLDRHMEKENAIAVRLVSADKETFYNALFHASVGSAAATGGGGGDATAANQTTMITHLATIAGDTTSLDGKDFATETTLAAILAGQLPDGHNVTIDNASIAVTGTFWQATQPISAASLPLPSGAATAANQQTDALTDTQLRATPVEIMKMNTLVPAEYDYISLSYTGDNLTGVVYKTGGSGGSTVATLTLAYTGSQLDSVTKS